MSTAKEIAEELRKKKQEGKSSSKVSAKEAAANIRKRNKILETIAPDGVNEDFINTFISDANNFLGSAEEEYGKVAWGNASSVYDTRRDKWIELDAKTFAIRKWLDQNKGRMDEETYSNFSSTLDEINKGATSVVDSFKSASDFYSQFETEAQAKDSLKIGELYSMSSDDILKRINSGEKIAYTTSDGQNVTWQRLYDRKKKAEEFEALYGSVSSSGDWDEYVQKGANIENPSFGNAIIDKWNLWQNLFDEKVVNPVSFGRENKEKLVKYATTANSSSDIGNVERFYIYNMMSDEEADIYYYYLGKGDKENAKKYLKSIEGELKDRREAEILENSITLATDYPVLASLASVALNVGAGLEYITDTANSLFTHEIDTNLSAQQASAIRGTVSANTNLMIGNWDAFDFVYNTGMSAADSVASMALLGNAGGVALGLSAAAQGTNDALARGMSNNQAFWNGFASGVFEGIFETVSIGQFSALKEGATTSFKSFAKNLGKSMLVNASEETLTELSNIAYDWVVNGDFSQAETAIRQYMQSGMSESEAKKKVALELGAQVVESGASGALMGIGFGAAGSGMNYVSGSINAKKAYGTGSSLVNEALETASNGSEARAFAEAYKAALDGGKNLSGGKLYKLSTAYNTDIASQDTTKMKSAVEARLTELGEESNIEQLSAIIVKQASGEKLSVAEKSLLRSSYAGQRVANELDPDNIASGEYTSDWAEKIGTRHINASAYNKGLHDLAMETAGATVGEETDSATVDSTPTKEIAPEAKNTVSDDGKTVLIDTNEEIEIQGIASIENGKVTLRTNKGEVDAKDISFGTDNEALIYEAVTDMTAEAARNMIDAYDPSANTSTSDYIHGFKDSYRYGYFGFPETELAKGVFTKDLSEEQRHIAYTVGKNAGEAAVKEAQKKRTEAKEKGDKTAPKKGKVYLNGKEYTAGKKTGLDSVRDASVKGIAAMTDALGVNVYFYESYLNKEGKRVYRDADGTVKHAPHGFYDADGIHIDLNAGKMGEGLILYTAAHELTHFIRDWSPAKFKVFADFLLENYAKKGKSIETLVQAQIEKAAQNGREISYDTAYEEVIADSCQAMLADGKAIQKIAELKAKDKTLWQKIKSFLSDIVAKIKNAYAGLDPYSAEGRFVKNQLDTFEQLQTMWTEALIDAGETYSAVRDALGEDSTIKVNEDGEFLMGETKDGKVLLNDRTWDEGGRETLKATLSLEGYSDEEINAALIIMDGKHKLVEQLNKEFTEQDRISKATLTTDLKTGKAVLSALVSNGDYPVNIDLLMVCKKRQAYQRVINRLCETGLIKQATLDSLAIAEINKILGKYGFETACLGCFVESRRIRIQEWAETICNEWNGIVDKMVGKDKAGSFNFASETFVKDLSEKQVEDLSNDLESAYERDGLHYGRTTVVKKMEQLLREVPSLRKHLTVADLITPQGRTHLKQLSSELNSLVACRYGSNTPKIVQDFNPYNHELAQYGTVPTKYSSLREYLYAIGGARMQSFSDFIIENWFDYCQIVADLAARKLPMHTYTKEIVLAKLFGMTGIKINMSLIPDIDRSMGKEYAGLTRNAKGELELIWGDKDRYKATGGKSYMQSINFADAVALMEDPRYSANVGTIAVGVSDAHILMMLDDSRIRMVIPYHSSGMNPIFANLVGTEYYNDYTNDQNTTVKHLIDSKGNVVSVESLKLEKSQKDNLASGFEFNAVLQELGDARAAAKAYLEWCADASQHTITIKGETYNAVLKPKFEQFSSHENYYKVLEDFNTYDCITEQAAPQGDVQQIYPDEFEDILRGELTVRENYRQKQEPKWDAAMGEIESFLKTHTKKDTLAYAKEHGIKLSKKDKKLSDRDSDNIRYDDRDHFAEDKYFRTQMAKWEELKQGAYVKVGQIGEKHPLHSVGMPTGVLRYDVDKLKRNMADHGDYLSVELLAAIPDIIADPVAISEYSEENTVSVFGDVFVGNSPMMVGVTISRDRAGNDISKVRTFNARRDVGNLITDDTVLYLGEDKKRTRKWFQACGIQVPLGETRFGFIRSISQKSDSVKSKFSDREVEEISNSDYVKMYNHFGSTKNYNVAGYMLQNGVMLDFSGKHWGNPYPTSRDVDHREIQEILDDRGHNGVNAMIDMIGNGNIRLMPEIGGINLAVKPNDTQMSQLRGYINHFRGEVVVDIDKVGGDTIHSFTYPKGTSSSKILSDIKAYFDNGTIPQQQSNLSQFRYSDRDSYAPVFYSHMGKVIDDIKIAKMGAGGVVPYLKGRGVKDEEIKWSGIEAFLEGKKSVTKEELQEFVAGSQLQIAEQMSDPPQKVEIRKLDNDDHYAYALYSEDGEVLDRYYYDYAGELVSEKTGEEFLDVDTIKEEIARDSDHTRWSQYKLDGGSNYRELIFQTPNNSYSNRAMRGHWGQDAEGILVHARIQDFDTAQGKMLFVEELQSDWHNEGHEKGYSTEEYEAAVASRDKLYDEYKKLDVAFHKYVRSNEFMKDPDDVRKKKHDWLRGKVDAAYEKYLKAKTVVDSLKQKGMGDVADAPFRDTYHEYVMKRLIRMAAEEGYDIIGWTPSEIQVDRWSEEYAEGYRIEYDQEIPKFLKKYGKRWGTTVGHTAITQAEHTINGEHYDAEDIEVWSMPITDSMKKSVLTEGQPLYSDRSDSDISNRELLANSLESAAANDIERNKLALYKQKIALINAEEQKLHELKAEIGELSFAKGSKDMKRIKDLQFEAKQTENSINTYDRQLLTLEASAPLKAVLDREKKMAYKKAEKRGKDALAAYREKAAADKRKLLERASESRKKGIEGRRKTEMRHKIRKVVSDLDHLLRHGSKDRNVKLGLQAAVASALEAVNMDTVAADERIAKLEKELMQAKTPEKIQEISRKIDHIREQGDKMTSKLEALRRAYVDIKNSEEGVPDYYKNEANLIAEKVDSVMKKVGDTPLRNMSLSQLEEVHNLYSMVLTTVRNVNSLFVKGKLDDLHQNVNEIMTDVESVKPLKEERLAVGDWWRKQSWSEMIPVYAFERIGSKKLTSFYWEVVRGQNTFATDISEAKEFSSAARKKYGYSKWDLGKIHEFKLADGRTLRVTLKHMMSIYAYSKREQALDHMSVGGFFFNDKDTFRKEKGVLKVIKSNEEGYVVSNDTFAEIMSAMTKEQIQYVDEMQDYLTKMGAKGNEVSRVLWGIDIFKEKVYFPLKSSRDFIYQANQPAQESSLKNDGMTKETIPHASNPIVLEAFDDVWANHVERMSKYHAFVLPIENLNKIHNYGTWVGTASMSVSTMLRARYSDAVNEYLTQFIRDLNGASTMSGVTNPVFGLFNKFKKTAVAASTSVVVQQPTAVLRATAVLDPKYFVGKPNLKRLSKQWNELQKYAPISIIKDVGGFDAGGGRQISEWINTDTKRGLDKVMSKVDDITMFGAALGDQFGWCTIWDAVKRETLHNNPKLSPTSEEFLQKAGERFTEIIVLTQVYDSTLSRSGFMRSKHESVKMMTSFMGEPTVSFNMLMNAVTDAKAKRITKRQAARTIGAVYASVVAASVASSMIYALRDDDEDESYLEKFAEAFMGKLLDDVNPINMLPIMRDIMSIMDGWDVERTDVAIFKDIKDAFDGLFSENKSAWRKVEDFAGAIASLFGIPLKNTLRTGREIYNLFENIFDADLPTGSGIKDSIVEGITGKEKSNGQQLYEAILSGDQNQIDRVNGRFKDQTAIDTAIRKALRENDPRIKEAAQAIIDEDYSRYTELANQIIGEGYFSENNVVAAIKSQINAMTKDEEQEEEETEDKEVSIYEMNYFYNAALDGDIVMAHAIKEDIVRTAVANGKDREEAEKSFNSSFQTKCREAYKEGRLSESEAVRMLVNYGGKTEAEARSRVQSWK